MHDYVKYHDNGSIKIRGQTDAGKKVGVWSFFKKNGCKVMEAHFSNTGKPLFNFYFDERGSMIEQGHVVVPHANGQIAEQGLVKNCLKQGVWTYYDINGKVQIEGEHKNGFKEGLWKYYDAEGRLQCSGTCHKNQWHGTVVIYDKDGSTKQTLLYHHGEIASPCST